MMQIETLHAFARDAVQASLTSFGALSKGAGAAALEVTDYARTSFEQTGRAVEALTGARSLDAAIAAQGEFLRTSYEAFVARASRVGTLATDTAREAFAPVETLVSSAARAP